MPDKGAKRLSYCDKCSPPIGLAAGRNLESARHNGSNGKVHLGTMVEISEDERVGPGETPQGYLERLTKKYAK